MRMSLTAALRMDASSLNPEARPLQPEANGHSGGRDSGNEKWRNDVKVSFGSNSATVSVDGSVGNASCTETSRKSKRSQSEGSCEIALNLASAEHCTDASAATHSDDANRIVNATGRKQNPGERLQRSRERNRIHARKTRQRKKEQMQTLQNRADELKAEQIRLKQSINEKNTASILVGLFSRDTPSETRIEDPKVEELLRRPTDDIPDASKLPELPALILPGQHNSRKLQAADAGPSESKPDLPDDGIDYRLLGKDRSTCSPEELDQIRRERNRMHAKRTRDRKRLFMEEMSEMCKKLEEENCLLSKHLQGLNGTRCSPAPTEQNHSVVSPTLTSSSPGPTPPLITSTERGYSSSAPVSEHGVTLDQIKTLLDAAGQFSSKSASAVSASEGDSLSDRDDQSACKRRRLNDSDDESSVAIHTIAGNSATAVGC